MATKKYLDDNGLTYYHSKVKGFLADKVDKVEGKGLSTNDYTTAEQTKLSGIASGAQVNVIETVKVNNTALTPSSKAVNITVPTSAADVSALPSSTKYGASMTLSINSTTYVVTAQLKDQDGNALGTAQTIDLPLESVVVSGSYDATNKKVVLTLQDGSTIDFSVADLVAGLQTEITSSNKLGSDLVDDTSASHKFATASQLTKLDNLPTITTIGTNLSLSNGTLSATDTTYSDFTGTDGTAAGASGLVPAPATTDAGSYLKADGTWGDPTFTLPIATANDLGGIKVGTNLSINSTTGVLSATDTTYSQGTGITISGTTISMTDTYTAVTNAEIDTIVAS